ncbi:MAG: twin-arginine translocase TatA/TatE family subunit [Actinomycetota bacterium]|nr:twin-arginine translocase TatA/TatE family subunit [Actinomycetota bacterium]
MLPTPMGGMELLIILVIILLFFGAKRVPELGRSLGKGVKELRQGAAGEDDEKEANRPRAKDGEEEGVSPSGAAAPRAKRPRTKEGAGTTPRPSGEQDL